MRTATPYSAGSTDIAARQNKVLRNTYLLLAISLIPTVIGAAVGTNFINFSFMRASPIMSVLLMLVVFYGWIFAIEKNRDSVLGVGLLLGFTAFLGLMMAPLLQNILSLRNGGQLVMMAAGGTAAVFFVLSGIAASTKRDFSFLNKFLLVGFVVIMLSVLANIFLQSPLLQLTLCGAFIIFSSAIILWQINSIVRGGETNYVSATLTLYVSLYNIFTSLLQLLGIMGGDRD
ncbi:MAG: Bax inhibitor-1/YccA family protein [Burkholderiales bacterium]|nr:Bax inhibitor-1/YccA family protein [Burkholderiales bacterium]MDP2398941.1 Bax inhibitor-1/YccA family protein [Burkholderiales bacterium]